VTTCISDNPPSALIKVPTSAGNGSTRDIPCFFYGMQGKCLVIEARESLTPGMAISVECDDALFLGEVVTCSNTSAAFRLEVRVEQILTGLQSLMALRSALLDERVPSTLRLVPAGMDN
jgi:hypothetical protein